MPLDLPPTRAAGLARLERFVPRAGRDYAERRNLDLSEEGHPHVSVLSPYVRHRLVTEAEVLGAILERHGPSAAQKAIQEVFWRTYFKGVLELRPSLWTDYLRGLSEGLDGLTGDRRAAYEAAVQGRTGIENFDHWARELAEANYLHNHARMWFASIWIFTLRLPWELGADVFLRHLLDGDAASNTRSWRWVAGLQTRGKHYLARGANISTYTRERFAAETGLDERAAPLEGPPLPEVTPFAPPEQVEPAGRWGALLHEDDLSPGFLPGVAGRAATAALAVPAGRSPLGVSEAVAGWVRGAAEDALSRHGPGPVLEGPEAVADWTLREGLDLVVAPYAPTGWTRSALMRAERMLADRGVGLVQQVRPLDAAAWPQATDGFFRFRKAIPDLLQNAAAHSVA